VQNQPDPKHRKLRRRKSIYLLPTCHNNSAVEDLKQASVIFRYFNQNLWEMTGQEEVLNIE
jgi:hypothetical protein